jgi:hypothetical protein
MKKKDKTRTITPMDVAKFLGVENEYKEALFEQELKENHDIIMNDDIEKNNTMKKDSNNENIK